MAAGVTVRLFPEGEQGKQRSSKYIVTESFIDALIYATVPTDLDHDESLSPLEEDFDKNWPDAMQHVPPRGKEPNERPIEAFAPNPERANVFEGYTFVFCEKSQFEQLQPPITNGGGKAFLFKLKPRQTTTEELVGYVKNVAGEKGLGELEAGSEGKGVVVVKFRGGKDEFDWAAELGKEASLALDLRFIEQNEFMDAILMNDASVLRRPLEAAEDDDYPDSTNRAAVQNGKTAVPKETQPEESRPPPPSRRQRGLVKSRFKGFSDDDDDVKPSMSSIPAEGTQGPPEPSQLQTQHEQARDTAKEVPNSRKRPAPEPDDDDDFVDQLLPAAAAMKRRRLEEARLRGESPSATFNKGPSPPPQPKQSAKKATSQLLDIKKSIRERRAAAEKAAARESEDLRESLETANIEAMRDLAVIEKFEIPTPRSNATAHGSNQQNGERWNPAWNGRKNFKKFRRQGEVGARRGGGQGVIVPLEEVKKKGFGIGEGYWLEKSSTSLKRKRENRAVSQIVEEEGESLGDGSANMAGTGGKKKVPKELLLGEGGEEESGDEEMGDVVDVEAPRQTRKQTQKQTQTQTQTQKSSVGGGASRGRAVGVGAAKKQGRLFEASDDESSEEDELKFRFGKRRRLQQ
ncbi:hypothetical protein Q9189_005410 [Teloschistes chrysophthalmus]